MHKSAMKCNETIGKWCKNKHGASKIIDTLETYQGGTPGADRWGGVVYWVQLPAWWVGEMGERSWERSWQDLEHARLGSPLLPLFSQISNMAEVGWCWVWCWLILLDMGAKFSWKEFAPRIKEKKRKENHTWNDDAKMEQVKVWI
jgi:hypothetical protein